jgi:hypothetical protein
MTTVFSVFEKVGRAFVVVVVGVLVFAVTPAMAEFGVERFAISARNENGTPDVQAGSHPYALTTTFVLNQPLCNGETCIAEGDPKDVKVELPPGLVGDANATPRCTYETFIKDITFGPEDTCASDTAVGVATSYVGEEKQANVPAKATAASDAVYNLVPPPGVAAEFGYVVAGEVPVLLQTSVRTGSDYGLTVSASNVSQAELVYASKVTIWGVPASPAHNQIRGDCLQVAAKVGYTLSTPGTGLLEGEDELEGPIGPFRSPNPLTSEGECVSDASSLPLLTLPTSCGEPGVVTLRVDSWNEPGNFSGSRTQTVKLPALTGCGHLELSSSLSVKPEKSMGSTPSGLVAEVDVPQEGLESPTGLAASDVKDGTMVFPEGLQLNASAANGLATCSTAQIGFTGFAELNKASEPGVETPQFTPRLLNPATGEEEPTLCPAASRVGNVYSSSPLLEGELVGGVYQAAPQNFTAGGEENPFRSLLALYAVLEEPTTGVLVKFPIKVTPSATGQLTGAIEHAPQVPFKTLKLEFYGGERAPLATPAHCGIYSTSLSLNPWAGGQPFDVTEGFQVTTGPGGSACPAATLPFTPTLATGVTSTTAGAFTPLSTSLGREDGEQDIQSTSITFPPGVSAVLRGVPVCGEAQANTGTCPAGSQIGEDTASVGFGQDPYTVTGGKVYLTGPYEGAPFGLSIVTPAQAGPFILQQGAPIVTRAKIEINPATAQVTATTTGAIPRIIEGSRPNEGIPVEIKHVNLTVNRPDFAINPTSCERMSVTGTVGGWEGASALVSDPFQVVSCGNLAFSPTIGVSTGAHSSKAGGASLNIKVSYPAGALGGQAWFKEAKLVIPKQLPAELKTIQQACLAATFEANPASCPAHSKIGEALVHTQLLAEPLKGPIYFVSYGAAKFPDAIILLSGDNVNVRLTSETFIKNGVTSVTLPEIPGVPVESAEFSLPTGEYSEFGTNLGLGDYDFCGQKLTVPTEFKAQNGLEIHQETPVTITGCPNSISIQSKSIKKRTLTLTVYTPAAGKITATGHGLTTRTKTAKGQELLTLTLTPKKKTSKLKTKIHITYTPTHGKKQTTTTPTISIPR